jgi:hypothetical protein
MPSGEQITDLNEIPKNCKMLIVSELPMIISASSNFLKPKREHSVPFSFDLPVENRRIGHDQS